MRAGAIALAITFLAGCAGIGASRGLESPSLLPARHASSSPIQHVVVLIQENRSFDNLFAGFPGADGATRGKERVQQSGKWIDKWVKLAEHSLLMKSDLGHCYYAFVTSLDDGKMDGFDLAPKGVCPRGWGGGQPAGTLPYQFVNRAQIAPYWDIARQYVLADHMFQTQGSGSFTAHQDLIRGGSAVSTSETMIDTPDGMPWGCDAKSPATRTDALVNGKWKLDAGPFPCTKKFPSSGSYETLADLLDAKSVTWKYYSPCFSASPNCNNSCTECAGALLNAFDVIAAVRYGPEWSTNVSMPQTNILKDISKAALPAVSWVVPSDADSDHPGATADHGPEWIASIVNAIGESAYWNSTAVVVVWDDWGGLYDHVKPPLTDTQGGLGFRVPMLVVSPYVAQGKVTHTQYEFGSILKYVENNWALGSLGTSDQRAASIGDVFDYGQQPRSFTPIPSHYSADFFLREAPSAAGDPE